MLLTNRFVNTFAIPASVAKFHRQPPLGDGGKGGGKFGRPAGGKPFGLRVGKGKKDFVVFGGQTCAHRNSSS